ncbi:MAG TPA: hypothetical protein VGJ83_05090 [Gemmatimonadales bacterium]|jgi:hypothetical protein
MTIRVSILLVVVATVAAPLRAQQDVAARLAGRVPQEVIALVRQLSADAAARGLPVEPLIQKAIEGGAKAVPADRIAAAVRGVVVQLDGAAAALADAGLTPPDTETIAAGAFALNAGLDGRDVASLARVAGRANRATIALRVAGTLSALGVPAAETVTLVSEMMRAGRGPAELTALPARLQAEVARGATPAQAATGLARAAAAPGRSPQPPRRGPPPRPPN